MGHSIGGLASLVASTTDNRIKKVIALSPPVHASDLLRPTNIPVSVLLLVGTEETNIFEGNTMSLYYGVLLYYDDLISPKKQLIVIEGGDHIQYMDGLMVSFINFISNFIELPFIGNEQALISTEEQHEQMISNCLEFLGEI